ncbi:DUF4397 domain-containing protein [Halalkalicoccus subterraneus]|uniref:DUF4397 domain-containing protein n=1 Tax=Halalkalicoccus subterraneus TaxID=2675002 RepID=UPI001FE9D1BE|nr:DUF4397 domain-containing protein [Halalkalicoccus subterraneus]
MTKRSETNDDGSRKTGRMPNVPINCNPEKRSESTPEPESGSDSGQSRRGFLAASAAVGFGAAGLASPVGADGHDGEERHTVDSEAKDGARIVHLSPDAPVVDVSVGGELWFEDVEPFATGTVYLEYVPETYTVQFTPAGEGPESAVLESDVTFEEGRYTVAAVGEACAVSDEPLRLVTLEDDTTPTSPGHARVRGVHASVDAPPVDFTVGDGEGVIFEDLGFGEEGYGEVSADEAVIEIREHGTGEVVERFEINFEAGTVYTVFAVGYLDPENAPEIAVENASLRLAITEDASPGER